jgi:hypothetical protein
MKSLSAVAAAAIAALSMLIAAPGTAFAGPPVLPPVIKIPPYKPVPTILEPEVGDSYNTYSNPFSMPFMGTAKDPQDGAVPGTSFKWTATPPGSRPITFCTGSSWPGSGDIGSFGSYRDCGHGVARLSGTTGYWTVTLCVADKQANIGCTTRSLLVYYNPS